MVKRLCGLLTYYNLHDRDSLVGGYSLHYMAEWLSANDRSTYRLFISHSWEYSDSYNGMVELLNDVNFFEWHNYSVPEHDPVHAGDDDALYSELEDQIGPSSVVVILAGMYVNDSKWIGNEIEIAEDKNKPIVGVKPWGSQRTPEDVKESADELVGWAGSSVADAARDLSP